VTGRIILYHGRSNRPRFFYHSCSPRLSSVQEWQHPRVFMSGSKAAPSLHVQTEHNAVEHYHVFISYRRGTCGDRNINDLVSAIQLQLMLKARGLDVFVDKSGIAVGDKWRYKFMSELKQAQVVIMVITRNTLRRYERPPPPKTDIVSMLSGMLSSGVQALAEPLVSLAGGGGDRPHASPSDGVDNVLLEWMIALSLNKIIIPVFIGDSDPITRNVGGLLGQGVLQNLAEPPAGVIDATRTYASAFLASQFEPPVLLPQCCSSLSSMIQDGILELNGVEVKSVAWEIVADVVASKVLESPLLRDMLDQLTPKKQTPGLQPHRDDSLSSGSPDVRTSKALVAEFNASFNETLYENCFLRSQLWPHVTAGTGPRKRSSVGFSLFIAEPAELRGTCVDLLPPDGTNSSFYVYLTRGEDSNCNVFVKTWTGNRCTLQLPYIDISYPYISRHHATLLYNRSAFERNGIGLADGHFKFPEQGRQVAQPTSAAVECPCSSPNPHGKTCSDNGTFVLSYSCPPAGKERPLIMRKRIPTAAKVFEESGDGGFAALDGAGASFMYFMLSNVVIGVSDPSAPSPAAMQQIESVDPSKSILRFLHHEDHDHDHDDELPLSPSPLPPNLDNDHDDDNNVDGDGDNFPASSAPAPDPASPFTALAPSPASPRRRKFVSADSPQKPLYYPWMLSSMFMLCSVRGGTVEGMEQGGWEKVAACWND